ncbi:hypothetical protein ACJX0J_013911 [Zea mays]
MYLGFMFYIANSTIVLKIHFEFFITIKIYTLEIIQQKESGKPQYCTSILHVMACIFFLAFMEDETEIIQATNEATHVASSYAKQITHQSSADAVEKCLFALDTLYTSVITPCGYFRISHFLLLLHGFTLSTHHGPKYSEIEALDWACVRKEAFSSSFASADLPPTLQWQGLTIAPELLNRPEVKDRGLILYGATHYLYTVHATTCDMY